MPVPSSFCAKLITLLSSFFDIIRKSVLPDFLDRFVIYHLTEQGSNAPIA